MSIWTVRVKFKVGANGSVAWAENWTASRLALALAQSRGRDLSGVEVGRPSGCGYTDDGM